METQIYWLFKNSQWINKWWRASSIIHPFTRGKAVEDIWDYSAVILTVRAWGLGPAQYYTTGSTHLNVILRCVRATTGAVEKGHYIIRECFSSLRYPACNAHVLYYSICGLSGCTIFFQHYFINGTLFGKKLLNTKTCFHFLYIFCLKHFSF